MSKIIRSDEVYLSSKFINEKELEDEVLKNYESIFGKNTIYFLSNKRFGSKENNLLGIPDAFLINFSETNPKLYVIENELSTHDAYKHIGLQLWKFITLFKKGSRELKTFLLKKLKEKDINKKANKLLINSNFPNLSELLDYIIFDNQFSFIVVIDRATDELNSVLKELARTPDVIEFKKYVNTNNKKDVIYRFSEFQEDIKESLTKKIRDMSEMDTIVCAANEDGFKEVFLGENQWYAIRISSSMIPQLKYIAMYETAPISSIRYYGLIKEIKPYKDTGKYIVYLSERRKIGPIKSTPQERKAGKYVPQGPTYTKFGLLKKGKTLKDIF